jgi:DNA-binding transcriptional ArsR family regulator
MGLKRIEEKLTRETEIKRKGAELALKSLETMSKKVQDLHTELEKLEKKFQADFKKNPVLSQKLMDLRAELGLPRAIGIYEVRNKPSILQKLKGKDEYQNYLALRIIQIGKEMRTQTGGIIGVSELALQLSDESQGITVSIRDITTALDLLKQNGMIHDVRQVGGMKIIEFINPNLTKDHEVILELATQAQGQISLTQLIQETSWTIDRVNLTVDALIQKKIAIKTETLDGVVLSFPGI